jgi:3-hydroxybutyryl-CoA dehydratase
MDSSASLAAEDWSARDSARLSARRTITVTDIVNFAGVSGDFAEVHLVDEAADENALFPGRVAHGLLGLVIQNTLGVQALPTAGLAFLGIDWRFVAPIFPGDTVHVRIWAADKRPSRSRPGAGVVTFARELVNQRGEVVQQGTTSVLVRCRGTG